MTSYSLVVKNNSQRNGCICVYQTAPNQSMYDNLFSLAWFAKACRPGVQVEFKWNINYSFVWSDKGNLIPGVVFKASEVVDADPSNGSLNSILLDHNQFGYKFLRTASPASLGTLKIVTDPQVPVEKAAVGIGMSGAGTFVQKAKPNLVYSYQPHPQYWLAFGTFEQGEVLDLNVVTEQAMNVHYSTNVYNLRVNLNEDNTWAYA